MRSAVDNVGPASAGPPVEDGPAEAGPTFTLCGVASAAAAASFFSFAFLRIFTRSTMGVLHLVFASGGDDAADVDRLGVFAECIEQCRGGECVDHTWNAATQRVNLFHGLAAERIACAPG